MFQNNVKQCCGSGMFVPDPDLYPSWIPDPGFRIQKHLQMRKGKKLVVLPHFVATNITKLKLILFWTGEEKNFGPIDKELKNFIHKNIVIKLSKLWFGVQVPEKNIFWILDPGVRKAPDPGSIALMLSQGSSIVNHGKHGNWLTWFLFF